MENLQPWTQVPRCRSMPHLLAKWTEQAKETVADSLRLRFREDQDRNLG